MTSQKLVFNKYDQGEINFSANVDERNRVTIPKNLASLILLKKGDLVEIDIIKVTRIVRQ